METFNSPRVLEWNRIAKLPSEEGFTGIKTGKSTFLERKPKFFDVSIVEQDECIIDTGNACNCRYIQMYKNLHDYVFEPIILLAATNLLCWRRNFSDSFPSRFYSSPQWYDLFDLVDEDQRLKTLKTLFSPIA